ncbi:MAG TPA: sensor histidine kinase, partial [Bacilli bacterium]
MRGWVNLFQQLFRNSIKSRLTVYLIMFSTIPLVFANIFLYNQASRIVEQQAEKYAETVLSQTISRVNQLMDDVTNASVKLVTNPEIQNEDFNSLSPFDQKVRIRTIESFMTTIMISQPEISSMYLCMEDAGIITPTIKLNMDTDFHEYRSYQLALDNNLKPVWMGVHENEFDEGTVDRNRYVLTFSRTVYSPDNYKPLGVLIINISDETIKNIFANSLDGESGIFYITDSQRNVIYHKDPSRNNTKFTSAYLERVLHADSKSGFIWKDGQGKKYIHYFYSRKSDWIYVAELPIDYVTRNSDVILKTMTLIVSICIALSIAIAFILANRFTLPVKRLISSMRRVKDGDINKTLEVKGTDEIAILTHHYNKMIQEIQELLVRVEQEHVMKRQAELNTLQAQITPHFLYNSLNSIKALARMHNDELIYSTAISLIGLLQLSISKNTVFITIDEEVQMIKHFMTLQNIRYQDKIKVLYEIDEELLECPTVKLILQPLVENSIMHGLELTEKIGIIVVRVYQMNGDICLEVEDNGKGMDPMDLQGLLLAKPQKPGFRFSGIGLMNVEERIKMH